MKKTTYLVLMMAAVFLFSSCSRQYTYYQLIPRNQTATDGFASIKNDKIEPIKKIETPLVASNKPDVSEEEKKLVLKKAFFSLPQIVKVKKKKAEIVGSSYTAANVEVQSAKVLNSPPLQSFAWDRSQYLTAWLICLGAAIVLSAVGAWFIAWLAWVAFVVFFILWLIQLTK